MYKKIFYYLCLIVCLNLNFVIAQNNRIQTSENIGWYNYFGTIKLTDKIGVHTEYQWRRDNYITDWQQSLLRVGVNYQASNGILLRAGYGWIETFNYGDIPLNAYGKNFTEHRIFQMAQLTHNEGKVSFSHRFMLEQRFVGKYSSANVNREDSYPLLHRIRYMFRMQAPFVGSAIGDKTPYWAMYNEVFIGFGKNVNANVFDQNRLGILLGYQWNKNLRIEAGYLNQIVQFGRQINGQNVFQDNKGIILNVYFNAH
ncbi:MAG: DUF2490 domain-containing protein [Bacteroidia bacterium]|nr:DUF2490 domain-containing protein [Bacteroidia bacterium]